MKYIFTFTLFLLFSFFLLNPTEASVKKVGSVANFVTDFRTVLDDFNDGNNINNWGYNTYNGGTGGTCNVSYVAGAYEGSLCMKMDYSLSGPGGFAWYASKLGGANFDASNFNGLVFWVKGSAGGELLKIELKTTNCNPVGRSNAKVYINDFVEGGMITTTWKKVVIPFKNFVSITNFSKMAELTFVFEYDQSALNGSPLSGSVYIDYIAFTNKTYGFDPIVIDHYNDKLWISPLGGNGGFGNSGGSFDASFSGEDYHSYPSSLKLDYDLTLDYYGYAYALFGGGTNGWTAQQSDFSEYSNLSFWIKRKGTDTVDYMKVEMDTNDGPPSSFTKYIYCISTNWARYSIPLSLIKRSSTPIDTSKIAKCVFVLEASYNQRKDQIYIDDVHFEKTSQTTQGPYLTIDSPPPHINLYGLVAFKGKLYDRSFNAITNFEYSTNSGARWIPMPSTNTPAWEINIDTSALPQGDFVFGIRAFNARGYASYAFITNTISSIIASNTVTGKPYTNIQTAVNDAGSGETIVIFPVFYKSSTLLEKTNITIMSYSYFTGGDNTTVVLDGDNNFILTNARKNRILGITLGGSGTGFSISGSSESNVISHNRILKTSYGIEVLDNSADNNFILSNDIGDAYMGINIERGDKILIKDNNLYNNTHGIYIDHSPQSNYIIKNRIFRNMYYGIRIYRNGHPNHIVSNSIQGKSQAYGVYLSYATNQIIKSNHICFNQIGVQLYSSPGNFIINNSIFSNDTVGTRLYANGCYDNLVRNNDIWGENQNYGILAEWAHRNSLKTNRIHNNELLGIYLYDASTNMIVNNNIYSNELAGIGLYRDDSDHNVISSNLIWGKNQARGIFLSDGDHNLIRLNSITNNLEAGIILTNSASSNIINRNNIFIKESILSQPLAIKWNNGTNTISTNNLFCTNYFGTIKLADIQDALADKFFYTNEYTPYRLGFIGIRQSDTSSPSMPTNLSSVSSASDIIINWDDVPASSGYRVYRAAQNTWANFTTHYTDVSVSIFTDKNPVDGTNYYFITSYDNASLFPNESWFSRSTSGYCTEPIFKGLDDFNDNNNTNNWGFETASGHSSATYSITYNSNNAYEGKRCMKIQYNVTTGGSYVWYASPLGSRNFKASNYNGLSFWIKGQNGNETVKIGLEANYTGTRKKAEVYIGDFLDGGINTNWQKVVIPFKNFANITNFTSMKELSFVIEEYQSGLNNSPKQSSIYVDYITFTDTSTEFDTLIFDRFGDRDGRNAVGGNMGDYNGASHSFTNNTSMSAPYSIRIYAPGTSGQAGTWHKCGGGTDGWSSEKCDFSQYNFLTFYIKADNNSQNPELIKIEIEHGSGISSRYSSDEAGCPTMTTSWQKYTFPLANFSGLDKSAIKEVKFFTDSWFSGDSSYLFYIDNIQFEE